MPTYLTSNRLEIAETGLRGILSGRPLAWQRPLDRFSWARILITSMGKRPLDIAEHFYTGNMRYLSYIGAFQLHVLIDGTSLHCLTRQLSARQIVPLSECLTVFIPTGCLTDS